MIEKQLIAKSNRNTAKGSSITVKKKDRNLHGSHFLIFW